MAGRAPFRVAVVARAVMPLHGVGGLERSVHDLVRHLAARGVDVTLICPPAGNVRRQAVDPFSSPHIALQHVRYATFPGANRRGTTILDRSTAYPLFGWRAGRLARDLVRAGRVDLVHGFGASVLGYALERRRAGAPLVFNPQGLEEFGATAETQPMGKRVGYWPLRRAVRACSRRADAIIATDTALEPVVFRHLRPAAGQMRTIPNGIDLDIVDRLAGPDGRSRQTAERDDGSAHPLGSETRKGLRFKAVKETGYRKQLGGGHHTLSASAVNPGLEHLGHDCPSMTASSARRAV